MAGGAILVVDDNPMNVTLLEAILSTRGYSVRTAASAAEALASLQEMAPMLILMDLEMPRVDGFELTRRLKADPATRHIPIIAVTALAMKGDEERARTAGCDDYLPKPVDRHLLRKMIERHLAESS